MNPTAVAEPVIVRCDAPTRLGKTTLRVVNASRRGDHARLRIERDGTAKTADVMLGDRFLIAGTVMLLSTVDPNVSVTLTPVS